MSKGGQAAVSWEHVVDAALDGLGVLADGEFLRANTALAREYGYESESDIVGRSWRELYADDARARLEAEALPAVEASGAWQGTLSGRRADGTACTQELSLRRLEDGYLVWAVRGTGPEAAALGPEGTDSRPWEGSTGVARSRSGPGDPDGMRPRDGTDPVGRQVELERYETIIETVDDGVYVLDADLEFAFVNGAFCDLVGRSREELLGTAVRDLFAADEGEEAFAEEIRERVVTGDTGTGTFETTIERGDGETVTVEARYRLHPTPDDGFGGSVGVVRDITERAAHEERLQRQRDELETLSHINDLLHEVIRQLFEARTRERIERVVCERLAASELYRFAWIGERATTGDRVVPRVAAGDGDGYLDVLDVSVAEGATSQGPGGRAIRTGAVQVCQDIGSDPPFEPWREAALERGFRSAAAVPLRYDDTSYGVLAIYAPRPDGFSDHEQAGLAVLGETIGFALRALGDRRLLFADAVVELEFRITDSDLALVPVSAALDCRLELEGYLAAGDGDWAGYVEVGETRAADAAAALEAEPSVESVRTVRDCDEGGLLEVTLGPASFLGTVSELGARVVTASAADGAARLTIEAPNTTDTRDLADRVASAYPGAELLARSDHDRSVGEVDLPDGPMDTLTDRQREVLEAAYRAGYFDWPRESTGEEVAETLDVAAPTLHAHLRKAEARLLSELLD
jgi:PAS domain S-box-containing protein